ncbi:unnamed protein product [Sphenostylis stenocarpa]|uniref:Uncharacterized protein n=1 Tax=Sphenostylis stenocarpa TaxID=92480 RepID=A0AA86SRH7_9FABA|nr:unnamed protein product [Sphenostylis stenocarpa]
MRRQLGDVKSFFCTSGSFNDNSSLSERNLFEILPGEIDKRALLGFKSVPNSFLFSLLLCCNVGND